MKTLCAWDNFACLVDNFTSGLQGMVFGFAVVGFAFILACVIASLWKGL